MGNWSAQGYICHEGPRLSPDVPPYQRLREGPAGNTGKQKNKKSTFKAGMCMKTNKTRTKCPEKIRHFCLSFGHFRLTDLNFAEIRGELSMKRRNLLTKSLLASSLASGFDGGESLRARRTNSPRSARRWSWRGKHLWPAPPSMATECPAMNAWAAIAPEY